MGMRAGTPRHLGRAGVGLSAAAIAAGLCGGCARERRAEPAPSPESVLKSAIRGADAEVLASAPGLEVRTIVVDDRGHAVGALLRDADASAVTLVGADAGALRAAGWRLLAMPEAELDATLGPLRALAPVERRRLGQLSDWHAIATGPSRPAAALDGPATEVPEGRTRLLARCWFPPDDPQRLRIELLPQALRSGPATIEEWNARLRGERPGEMDRGVVFPSLAAALLLPAGWAAVLVPEDPALDWQGLPEPELRLEAMDLPAADDTIEREPGNPVDAAPGPDADGRDAVPLEDAGGEPEAALLAERPAVREPRTLGERMLAAPAEYRRVGPRWQMARPPRKALLVLVAHASEPLAPQPASSGPGAPQPVAEPASTDSAAE
jgi:hypothetical protein